MEKLLNVPKKINGSEMHGMKNTPEYRAWHCMKGRCHNPTDAAYKDYGARGILVCEEWRSSFVAFFNCIGKKPSPKHSLDRINNNLGYEPGNVRWATWHEQNNNKRRVYKLLFSGKLMSIAQISKITGISETTMRRRIVGMRWSVEKAVYHGVRPKRRNRCQ